MRKISTLAASALVLAISAGSAFAIPSGDRLGQPTNSVPASSYSAPAGYGHFTALAPSNGDNASQYTPLPLTNRGR